MNGSLTTEQAKVCMASGSECCIYVAASRDGFICIRGTSMGTIMLVRALEDESNAKWVPADDCRNQEVGGIAAVTERLRDAE